MSIEIKNITKSYGPQKAVDTISFLVEKGEVAGFIGPNGAGKSTTMKILTGYLTPDSGKALVSGIDATKRPMEVKKRIGYLPENNPLYPEMYIKEYLKYVLDLYPGNKEGKSVQKAIEKTGLGPEQHKKIGQLSKGYRQRVGLAQAIIHDPEVLILDEPTSGLDPGQIIEIRNLISELGREKTVLLSTHIMQEVEAICDRVILISKGRIKADGKPGEIKTSGSAHITLLAEFDTMPDIAEIENLKGVIRVKPTPEKLILVEAEPSPDPRQTIFDYAVEKNFRVLSMQKKEKSLEDVFRELTK